MPNAVRAHPHLPHVTLNSDGRPHPLLNALTWITFVFGLVSFALGFVVRAHLAACVIGLAALGIGLYAQMMSETREERMLIVTGLVAAFVGAGLGFAHGGFGV
jgi:hypothetical protein